MTLFDNVKAVASLLAAAARTADANGSAVDTQGYRDGMLVVQAGTIDLASTDETYVFEIEESDDGSTGWTDVAGTVAVTANNQTVVLRLPELNVARKRYLRVVLNVSGTTPSILCSAVILLGDAYAGPVNTD